MDLAAATSIAEIIASLGVVASLIFIAREFRHNARNTNLASAARALETQVHQFAHLADDPQKADLLRRALVDFDGLDQGEKGQVSAVIHDIILAHDDPSLKTRPLYDELPWLFAIPPGPVSRKSQINDRRTQ